MKLVQQG